MDGSADAFVAQLERLVENENDAISRLFFGILRAAIDSSPEVRELVAQTIARRPSAPSEHLAYVMFAAFQYVSGYRYDKLRPENRDAFGALLVGDARSNLRRLVDICATRNICTNVVNRYAGLKIIATLFAEDRPPLRIVEIGCSYGLGLRSILRPEIYERRVSIPEDPLLTRSLNRPLTPARILGLDIQDRDLGWLLASYLPEYIASRDDAKTLDQVLPQGSPLEFQKVDALLLDRDSSVPKGVFDIAWISNTCYQVEGDTQRIIDNVKLLLKPDGIYIYAYYRREESPDTPFDTGVNPYVFQVRPASRWYNDLMEVLESPDDKVPYIRRGQDFDDFYADFTR